MCVCVCVCVCVRVCVCAVHACDPTVPRPWNGGELVSGIIGRDFIFIKNLIANFMSKKTGY